MESLKLQKSVAYAMAEDLRKARHRILRKATPEETYKLLMLIDDLKHAGDQSRLESLANRMERGQHYLKEHLEIEDSSKAQEIANDMAADLRKMKMWEAEFDRSEITTERLKAAEELVAKYKAKVNLTCRFVKVPNCLPTNRFRQERRARLVG